LRILPRTSVEQYRGTTKVAHDIGQELDVEYLLEGSFQKFGDNARLIVQLIKARKESHMWANEYNNKWSEVFSIQSEVAQTIAKELYASITPEEMRLIEKVPTSDTAAYKLYLKANSYQKDYWKTRNISSYQDAVAFYNAALEIDPSFAKAYTGLASAYYDRYQWETYFKENYLDTMLVLANTALGFDDQLDEAYYLKGRYFELNGDIEEALENYDKTLKINPSYYSAYVARGGTWISTDFIKSITNYQQALNLIRGAERPALLRNLALVYQNVGFFDKAKYLLKDALQLSGDSVSYFYGLSRLEFAMGNFENAILFSEKASKIDTTFIPNFVWYSFAGRHQQAYIIANKEVEKLKKTGELPLGDSHRIGYAFDKIGKDKEAKFYYNQQIKYGEDCINLGRAKALNKTAHYDLAGVYAYLGDKTKAYQYLDEVDQLNIFPSWWINYAKHDPLFNKIRNEERFQTILQNMEAKYQAEHERVRKWLEETGQL